MGLVLERASSKNDNISGYDFEKEVVERLSLFGFENYITNATIIYTDYNVDSFNKKVGEIDALGYLNNSNILNIINRSFGIKISGSKTSIEIKYTTKVSKNMAKIIYQFKTSLLLSPYGVNSLNFGSYNYVLDDESLDKLKKKRIFSGVPNILLAVFPKYKRNNVQRLVLLYLLRELSKLQNQKEKIKSFYYNFFKNIKAQIDFLKSRHKELKFDGKLVFCVLFVDLVEDTCEFIPICLFNYENGKEGIFFGKEFTELYNKYISNSLSEKHLNSVGYKFFVSKKI